MSLRHRRFQCWISNHTRHERHQFLELLGLEAQANRYRCSSSAITEQRPTKLLQRIAGRPSKAASIVIVWLSLISIFA
ncbi:hypothetical protein QIH80_18640 [Bradyrhizobium elkanii]|nr:hypothetical protein QIH80_18640 [Bradyrhizobium elkanii]